MGAVHEALLGLRSPALPAHMRGRLRGVEQRCATAMAELARAAPGSGGLLAPLLLVFGDVPATLQEGLLCAAMELPFPAVLQLASSDELRVTSENGVLVRPGWGQSAGAGGAPPPPFPPVIIVGSPTLCSTSGITQASHAMPLPRHPPPGVCWIADWGWGEAGRATRHLAHAGLLIGGGVRPAAPPATRRMLVVDWGWGEAGRAKFVLGGDGRSLTGIQRACSIGRLWGQEARRVGVGMVDGVTNKNVMGMLAISTTF